MYIYNKITRYMNKTNKNNNKQLTKTKLHNGVQIPLKNDKQSSLRVSGNQGVPLQGAEVPPDPKRHPN